jgi:hypothetical protein
MRYTSLVRKAGSAIAVSWIVGGAFAFATDAFAAGAAQTRSCALVAPSVRQTGATATFEIVIDCESSVSWARPFPVGKDILVGLTVYADPGVEAKLRGDGGGLQGRTLDTAPQIGNALKKSTQSASVLVSGKPKWIVLSDEDAESYDLPAKVLRIDKDSKRITVQFQGDAKVADKQYMLFAAWPGSARKKCTKDSYARSGCLRDGYVIGDLSGVSPIAAYPGLEINDLGEYRSERWIVERFR